MREAPLGRDLVFGGAGLPLGWKPDRGTLIVATWMMATFASFRSREIWELLSGSGLDAQVKFQVASWCGFGLLAAWLAWRGRIDFRLVSGGPLLWYSVYIALAVLSTAYSPAPTLTAFAAMQLAVAVALVCAFGSRLDAIYGLVVLYVAVNWVLVILGSVGLNLGQGWIAPAQDIYVRFGGAEWETWRFTSAFGHPSLISIVAAMGAVGLAARTRGHLWRRNGFLIAWLALTVLLTVSRTGIMGMALGFLVVIWRRKMALPFSIGAAFAGVGILVIPELRDTIVDFLLRGQTEEDLVSLTGRTDLYATVWERLGQISFGEGFRAVRAELLDEGDAGQGISHAHNLFLEALIGLGLPGAAAVTATLLALGACAIRTAWHPWFSRFGRDGTDCEAIAILMPILAFSMLDSAFAMNANPFVIVFIVFAAKARAQLLALDAAMRRPTVQRAGVATGELQG